MIEREVQQFRLTVQRPANETDPHAGITGRRQFPGQPVPLPITAADNAEPAGIADRRRERAAGHTSHGRQQYRVFDIEHFGDGGADRHGPVFPLNWTGT